MALDAIIICPRISCFILFVFVLINFAINTACFTSNFRYFHNFLRKKVTLCISVNFSLILTPGISSKEFSAAILLLQVDRRWQKTFLGKVVKPVKNGFFLCFCFFFSVVRRIVYGFYLTAGSPWSPCESGES